MKFFSKLKVFCYLTIGLIGISSEVQANCFIVKDLKTNAIVAVEGECQERVSPCSTFKIPLSLMGYDSQLLHNSKAPTWAFKDEYASAYHVCIDKWKTEHDPMAWIKNSCIWYSQVLTKKLGQDKFKQYVELFNYGNKDISGDSGKNNGLTHSWLSSSLKISPLEEVEFLTKLLKNKIPVSQHAMDITKQILYISDIDKNWKLFGKTGSGYQLNSDGSYNKERQIGWFVGWVNHSTDNKQYVFAYLLKDQSPEKVVAGLRAKEEAEVKIKKLLK